MYTTRYGWDGCKSSSCVAMVDMMIDYSGIVRVSEGSLVEKGLQREGRRLDAGKVSGPCISGFNLHNEEKLPLLETPIGHVMWEDTTVSYSTLSSSYREQSAREINAQRVIVSWSRSSQFT